MKPRRPKKPRLSLQYKVVELSSVDESAIEEALNAWCSQGWTLDGIQFAMRESSKRPSMAFVLFTREGPPVREAPKQSPAVSARQRLAQLAGEDDA